MEFVRFEPPDTDKFYDTIKARVSDYFQHRGISPYANTHMWVKTTVMLLIYFIPYGFIVSGTASHSLWLFYGCWLCMGLGMIGIGTSVMHDAQHGAYSQNNAVNAALGVTLELVGGYSLTWKIQHNMLHHTFTNITGLDDDVDTIGLLRFSPRQPRRWYHRFQHIYAWAFYMWMTLFWATAKDYLQVWSYKKRGLLETQHISFPKALVVLTASKLFYFGYVLALPLLFAGVPWQHVIAGFLSMHIVAGLSLSCIFQPAHIMETSDFEEPQVVENEKRIGKSWAAHELANTTNFAPNNRLFSWFIGGLNFQIEHHLFTHICHVHYPKIVPIVRKTAEEFGVPYNEQPTFFKALAAHYHMLRKLGLRPSSQAAGNHTLAV